MRKLNWAKQTCFAFLLCAATAIALPAQTFTTLFSFDGTNGESPQAGLVQATNGDLFGTTFTGGGAYNGGTVFKITPSGTLTRLYSFCTQGNPCSDGTGPEGKLLEVTDGNFYGTTSSGGGAYLRGTVFKITPIGNLTTLYTFCSQGGIYCTDGAQPTAGLIQGADGNLYGTTASGGANDSGTVFKMTPAGMITTLYSFCSQTMCADGYWPFAGLIQGYDGNFYGTTANGGANDGGTVFKITPAGTLTTLYSFCSKSGCSDGYDPVAGLVEGADGSFYGTTQQGGANGLYDGTVFKISSSGTLTTLYSFCSTSGCTDGYQPVAGLVRAPDGNFYGTTDGGGTSPDCYPNGCGTVFKITPSGTFTTLYSFCSQSGCADGEIPEAGLIQHTNGSLYGATFDGGAYEGCTYGCGTVFSLSVGLGSFVEPQPTFGKVGAHVEILGTNLTGTASVTFNGTAAVFKVVSGSLIEATVPTGATSGKVKAVTPSRTLSSNVPFEVIP